MIGKQLKLLRDLKGKSQQEVCSELNIEQSTLANYENDRRIPKLDILVKMANYYNCSVDFIIGNEHHVVNYTTASESPIVSETEIVYSTEQELSPSERKLLNTFDELNEDNQDILIGKAKELLQSQRYQEEAPLRKAK